MNAINNFLHVFKNFANFSRRASRREYWMFFAMNFAVCLILSVIDGVLGFPILGLVYMLAAIVPGIAVSIRRLHDTDRSGWWALIGLIPLVGAIGLLVLMALPGTPSQNRFGEPEVEANLAVSPA